MNRILIENPIYTLNDVVMHMNETSLCYGQLLQRIIHTTKQLQMMGIKNKSHVLLMMSNCFEFIISFFSIQLAGGIVVLADVKWQEEIKQIFTENPIQLVISDDNIVPSLSRHVEELPNMQNLIQIVSKKELNNDLSMVLLENFHFQMKDLSDDAVILYTSGSTGKQKGVINTVQNLMGALKNAIETVTFYKNDRVLSMVPYFHSYALGSSMLPALASGSSIVLLDKFSPLKALKYITKYHVSVLHGVPYNFDCINRYYDPMQHDLTSLRLCVSGGSYLSERVIEDFYKISNIIIQPEYGSSETGTVCMNHAKTIQQAVTSVGKPMKHVEMRIMNPDLDGKGDIEIKTPGRAKGYVGTPPFSDEWHRMGDVGSIDKDNNLKIFGRTSRTINVSGLKVGAEEVEHVLLKHPNVIDTYVERAYHEGWGEMVSAKIVRQDKSLNEAEIMRWCGQTLANYKIPRQIIFVDEIDRGAMGKVKNNT